jgi:hypothetical protein
MPFRFIFKISLDPYWIYSFIIKIWKKTMLQIKINDKKDKSKKIDETINTRTILKKREYFT